MTHLILISGVSRSGKSSLAKKLMSDLPNAIHLDQDKFVMVESEIPVIRDRLDWENPASINWELWKRKIDESLKHHQFVIAEGIFAFCDEVLNQQSAISIQLSTSKEEYQKRRQEEQRWGEEPDWYIEHVWTSHAKYHNPYRINPSYSFDELSENDYRSLLNDIQSFKV